MALITTKAIVVNSIKFNDSSLIVKCFTEENGLVSYIVRGVLKPKKKGLKVAYFQPLTQLVIVYNHQKNKSLHHIKEVQIVHPYQHIFNDIAKQSLVMFLSEIIANVIQEEEQNKELYSYLETSFLWLDVHDKIANFHLLFLLNFTKFLGFYPDVTSISLPNFDLQEGVFTRSSTQKTIASGIEIYFLKQLIGTSFDALSQIAFTKQERQRVLLLLLTYFKLHLNNFKTPKSLEVLETIFS